MPRSALSQPAEIELMLLSAGMYETPPASRSPQSSPLALSVMAMTLQLPVEKRTRV